MRWCLRSKSGSRAKDPRRRSCSLSRNRRRVLRIGAVNAQHTRFVRQQLGQLVRAPPPPRVGCGTDPLRVHARIAGFWISVNIHNRAPRRKLRYGLVWQLLRRTYCWTVVRPLGLLASSRTPATLPEPARSRRKPCHFPMTPRSARGPHRRRIPDSCTRLFQKEVRPLCGRMGVVRTVDRAPRPSCGCMSAFRLLRFPRSAIRPPDLGLQSRRYLRRHRQGRSAPA